MQDLETDRLRLRAWTDAAADVDFVFDTYSRWEVQRFIGRAPRVMADRSEAEAAITRWRSLDDPVHGIWAVEHRGDGQLLGTLLLKPIPASSDQVPPPPSGDTEIGWHFHPDAWGQGYATEAATPGPRPRLRRRPEPGRRGHQRSKRRLPRGRQAHRHGPPGTDDPVLQHTTCELFTATATEVGQQGG